MRIKVRIFNLGLFLSAMSLFDTFAHVHHSQHFRPQHIKSLNEIHETYRPKKTRMHMFHCFLIWPLIAGLGPFEVLIRKRSLSLLLLHGLKDFLEIKYVNSY